IDIATGDADAVGMIRELGFPTEARVVSVLDDRIERGALNFLFFEIVKTFAGAPAVIAAFYDEVHFFEFVLADVAGPQFAGFTVETHTPDVAQAVGPDFRPHTLRLGVEWVSFGIPILVLCGERIVFGNAVGEIAGARVDVKPENFAEQMMTALTDAVG